MGLKSIIVILEDGVYTLTKSPKAKAAGGGILAVILAVLLSVFIFGGEHKEQNEVNAAVESFSIEVLEKQNITNYSPYGQITVALEFSITNNSKYSPETIYGTLLIKNIEGKVLYNGQANFRYLTGLYTNYNSEQSSTKQGEQTAFTLELKLQSSEDAILLWEEDFDTWEVWYTIEKIVFDEGKKTTSLKSCTPVLIKESSTSQK